MKTWLELLTVCPNFGYHSRAKRVKLKPKRAMCARYIVGVPGQLFSQKTVIVYFQLILRLLTI